MKKSEAEPQGIPPELSMAAAFTTTQSGNLSEEDAAVRKAVQQGLLDFLAGQKLKEDAAKEEVERRYEASRKRIEETDFLRDQEQNNCSHMKQGGRDYRIGGQRLSSGQLMLICQWCQKRWYDPADPKKGEEPIPAEIFVRINGDMIGSSLGG